MRPRFRHPNQDDSKEQQVVEQPARLPESRRVSKSFPRCPCRRHTEGTGFRLACCFAGARRCRAARSRRSLRVFSVHGLRLPEWLLDLSSVGARRCSGGLHPILPSPAPFRHVLYLTKHFTSTHFSCGLAGLLRLWRAAFSPVIHGLRVRRYTEGEIPSPYQLTADRLNTGVAPCAATSKRCSISIRR